MAPIHEGQEKERGRLPFSYDRWTWGSGLKEVRQTWERMAMAGGGERDTSRLKRKRKSAAGANQRHDLASPTAWGTSSEKTTLSLLRGGESHRLYQKNGLCTQAGEGTNAGVGEHADEGDWATRGLHIREAKEKRAKSLSGRPETR